MNFGTIDKQDFKKELEDSNTTLIDLRTPEELISFGKIRDNQLLITFGHPNFVNEIKKLDKNGKYLLYCWHGNRSKTIMDYMKQIGFDYVKELKGGIDQWG